MQAPQLPIHSQTHRCEQTQRPMGEAAALTIPLSFPSRETPEVQLLMESPLWIVVVWRVCYHGPNPPGQPE